MLEGILDSVAYEIFVLLALGFGAACCFRGAWRQYHRRVIIGDGCPDIPASQRPIWWRFTTFLLSAMGVAALLLMVYLAITWLAA